jgi:hypothetical protein
MGERGGLLLVVWLASLLCGLSQPALAALSLRLPTVEARSGGTVDVPISVAGASGIGAIQFEVVFDPAIVTTDTVTRGPLAAGALIEFNPNKPGRLFVALATLEDINGDGVFVTARFKVTGKAGQGSTLAMENAEAWEGKSHLPVVLKTEAGNLKVVGGLPWWSLIALLIAVGVIALLLLWLLLRRRRTATREPAVVAAAVAAPVPAPVAAPVAGAAPERRGPFCSHCGNPNDEGARFCSRCGQRLAQIGA